MDSRGGRVCEYVERVCVESGLRKSEMGAGYRMTGHSGQSDGLVPRARGDSGRRSSVSGTRLLNETLLSAVNRDNRMLWTCVHGESTVRRWRGLNYHSSPADRGSGLQKEGISRQNSRRGSGPALPPTGAEVKKKKTETDELSGELGILREGHHFCPLGP